MRTRSDHAHVAPDHVEKLWQLIDAGSAYEPSDPCNALIVPPGRPGARRIAAARMHRSELEYAELPVALPDAKLPEEHRPRPLQLDGDRHDEQKRRKDDERDDRDNEIQHPLLQ